MFGQGKEQPDKQKSIPILTIDHFPGREYDVLNVITAEAFVPKITKRTVLSHVLDPLAEETRKIGADAVIGVRLIQFDGAGVQAYGTAIRFK